MSFKYLAPVVAIAAGQVAAQSSCSAATTTIQNAGDASGLAGCTTFSGSIAIATGTTDNIALDGVRVIDGDLIANNVSQLTSISSSTLTRITGSFTLQTDEILSTLNFPQLSEVKSIEWEGLPGLQGLSFTNQIQMAESVSIVNTQLSSLEGINLQQADTIDIQNNNYLDDITMQLGNVTDNFNVYANGRNVSVVLPNLIWANRINIANASSVSLPSLASVNGTFGLYSSFFESVKAPNLTVDMYGDAIEDAAFPKLGDVRGAFTLVSKQNIDTPCGDFKELKDNGVIKGTYTCRGEEADPSSSDVPEGNSNGNGGSGGSKGGSSGSKDSGASTMQITGAAGILGVVAVMFGLL